MQYILKTRETEYYQNFYDWYLRYYYKRNVNITGNPTITDNTKIYGGPGIYVAPTVQPSFSTADSWEIRLKCTYEGGGSNSTTFIGPYPADFKGPLLNYKNYVVCVYLSSNGTSWDIASEVNTGLVLSPYTAKATYWFKLGFTGDMYYLDYNIDGSSNYTRQWSLNSSAKIQGEFIFLNNSFNLSTAFGYGNIDLSECSIVQNGTTIWQGVVSDTTGLPSYDWSNDILVSDDTRTYSGEYTSRTLVNKVKTTSSDYDASEIVKRQHFLKANNNFYLFKTCGMTAQ